MFSQTRLGAGFFNLESILEKTNNNSNKAKSVCGLKNIGNSCFLNAVIQSLASLKSFQIYVQGVLKEWEESRNIKSGELSAFLSDTFDALSESKIPFKPHVTDYTKLKSKFLCRREQQDAHELMQFILNTLQDEYQYVRSAWRSLKDVSGKNSAPLRILFSDKNLLRHRSPFEGLLKNTMQCCRCNRVSLPSYQKFSDLSLSVPLDRNKSRLSLEDCLRYFTASETVYDVDCSSWTDSSDCISTSQPKCLKSDTSRPVARKKLSIARAPSILCLHIRRLVGTELGFSKLGCHISFPMRLDLSPFCSFDLSQRTVPEEEEAVSFSNPPIHCSSLLLDGSKSRSSSLSTPSSCVGGDNSYTQNQKLDCECARFDHDNLPKSLASNKPSSPPVLYNLVSIIEHRGTHSGGHYTVYRRGTQDPDQWYYISDEMVSRVDDVRNAQAYMLFYEKI